MIRLGRQATPFGFFLGITATQIEERMVGVATLYKNTGAEKGIEHLLFDELRVLQDEDGQSSTHHPWPTVEVIMHQRSS